MGALLALASALSYGFSDFLGGILSRRSGFARVALLGQVGGLVTAAIAAPLVSSAEPRLTDLAWGALSGAGTGIGMVSLFRGMGRGAMSVVVPVSAVVGVALPVLTSVTVFGERPAPAAWAGIALALPALWLVAGGTTGTRRALGDGLIAGFGIAVQYLALAQASPSSGIWPVAAGRVAAIAVVALVALRLAPRSNRTARVSRHDLGSLLAGALAALALVCYLFATRTQFLAVAVVLSSLYPIVPVLLGITALRERLRWRQTIGLGGTLVASVLIAIS
ncbi:EamA family transporter [Amycolatopsis circi]|uniref:EamA family transporter n=1 Tax=Amycolatopsis circi TaxID=871959 RepID=UPI000E23CC75|nr:EamA family transporter [Amycolatopsis circi]